MRVISKKAINQFIEEFPGSAEALLRWYIITKETNWDNYEILKKSFPATDAVGNALYVFNVGGNKFRIIARINFRAGIVYVRFVGTHKQYDRVNLSVL